MPLLLAGGPAARGEEIPERSQLNFDDFAGS